jgi:hypothetical protein
MNLVYDWRVKESRNGKSGARDACVVGTALAVFAGASENRIRQGVALVQTTVIVERYFARTQRKEDPNDSDNGQGYLRDSARHGTNQGVYELTRAASRRLLAVGVLLTRRIVLAYELSELLIISDASEVLFGLRFFGVFRR